MPPKSEKGPDLSPLVRGVDAADASDRPELVHALRRLVNAEGLNWRVADRAAGDRMYQILSEDLGDLQLYVQTSGLKGPSWAGGRAAAFKASVPGLSRPTRRALTLYRGTKRPRVTGAASGRDPDVVRLARPTSFTRSRRVAERFATEHGGTGYLHVVRVPAGVPVLDVAAHAGEFVRLPGDVGVDEARVARREKEVLLFRHVLERTGRKGRVTHWAVRGARQGRAPEISRSKG